MAGCSGLFFAGPIALLLLSYVVMIKLHGKRRRVLPSKDDVLFRLGDGAVNVSTLPARFDVLVWNIEKGFEAAFGPEYERLVEGRHLVLLQEYLDEKAVRECLLRKDVGMQFIGATSFCYEYANGGDASGTTLLANRVRTGVVSGATAAPISAEAFVTSDVEPVISTPKVSVATRYKIKHPSPDEPDSELLVVNTHGLNRASFESFQTQMRELANRIQLHAGPVLWGGDFNTNSRRKHDFLHDLVVRDLGMTEITLNPDTRKVSKLSRLPLDRVFIRGLSAERAGSIQSLGSYHNPITLALSVNYGTSSTGSIKYE